MPLKALQVKYCRRFFCLGIPGPWREPHDGRFAREPLPTAAPHYEAWTRAPPSFPMHNKPRKPSPFPRLNLSVFLKECTAALVHAPCETSFVLLLLHNHLLAVRISAVGFKMIQEKRGAPHGLGIERKPSPMLLARKTLVAGALIVCWSSFQTFDGFATHTKWAPAYSRKLLLPGWGAEEDAYMCFGTFRLKPQATETLRGNGSRKPNTCIENECCPYNSVLSPLTNWAQIPGLQTLAHTAGRLTGRSTGIHISSWTP